MRGWRAADDGIALIRRIETTTVGCRRSRAHAAAFHRLRPSAQSTSRMAAPPPFCTIVCVAAAAVVDANSVPTVEAATAVRDDASRVSNRVVRACLAKKKKK